MSQEQVRDLWNKVYAGGASEAEKQALEQVLADDSYQDVIAQLLEETYVTMPPAGAFFTEQEKTVMIHAATGRKVLPLKTRHIRRWASAAIITGVIAAGSYYLLRQHPSHPAPVAVQHQETTPGNKAVLTLANGQHITLDNTGTGELARQPGATVIQTDSGSIAYKGTAAQAAVSFNTLTTPRGGQFKLLLPDGSAAWLNAASSITYPTAFNSKERRVEITGEVYLEVARNERQPFFVTTGQQEIAVLGTSFNVNAYTDEASINTTLLDGAISITPANGQTTLLRPGQQASVHRPSGQLKVQPVNTALVMAWRNGLFSFERANIQTVMRQLSRWYNVAVVYEGSIPTQTFSGDIYRDLPLPKALEMLEFVGFHFEVKNNGNGNTIIVRP
ncbi:FecR domain-containing protein [Chitinophaga oryzae]|uniref:FecR domain-containing protein n=1 Tax=Chitinophaga oryzae TaxID=2725414 RepID=A0AAE7D5Z7_9BACT|nr:FecR domain-containing protein [Chitinophaga oryzae]QJB30629.1 FecR domain-containing protein [Chitinophaga oryzae]